MDRIIVLLTICLFTVSGFGQVKFYSGYPEQSEQNLIEYSGALINRGLQNVAVVAEEDTLYVTFENRRFRDEVEALRQATQLLLQQTNLKYASVEYTLQNRGLPTITSQFSAPNERSDILNSIVSISLNSNQFADFNDWRQRFKKEKENDGQWRVEFEIAPQLLLALGAARDPILHQLNLLPAVNAYLWRGARLRLQGIVPLSDELKNPADQFWRPRLMTLSQYVQLPKQITVNGTVGYLTDRRYGATLEVNKFFGKCGQVLLQGGVGLTGFASFPKIIDVAVPVKGWQIGGLSYWTYHIAAEYMIPRWNVRTRLEWKKVLLNRQVVRAEVWRQFNEIQLGFFLYRFEGEGNYGFQLALPLFPKRYAKPGRVHFKASRFFNYTYHTTQYYASDFSTGEDIWQFNETLHPAFMHNRFYKK